VTAQNIRLQDTDEEKVRARFEKSEAQLVPLESQIAFTDGLIDELVFRLYGLTPQEIQIVQGNASA